ncbi:MAG: hypothetical protein Q4P72_05695, partial [Eubacteriales bacterium]|nr:hypothetical protein [Eubacteriales bacterium]
AVLISSFEDEILSRHFKAHSAADLEKSGVETLILVGREAARHPELESELRANYGERLTLLSYELDLDEAAQRNQSRLHFFDDASKLCADIRIHPAGAHHAENSAFAIALGLHLGLSVEAMQAGLDTYSVEGDRERLENIGKLRIFHDYYNAAPASMRAAFQSAAFEEADPSLRYAVIGGVLELGETASELHRRIASDLRRHYPLPLDHVYFFGDYAADLADGYAQALIAEASRERGMTQEDAEAIRQTCQLRAFDDVDALKSALIREFNPAGFYLIKASHGYQMDRFAKTLAECASGTDRNE